MSVKKIGLIAIGAIVVVVITCLVVSYFGSSKQMYEGTLVYQQELSNRMGC